MTIDNNSFCFKKGLVLIFIYTDKFKLLLYKLIENQNLNKTLLKLVRKYKKPKTINSMFVIKNIFLYTLLYKTFILNLLKYILFYDKFFFTLSAVSTQIKHEFPIFNFRLIYI